MCPLSKQFADPYTCPGNVDPLTAHLYKVQLGLQGYTYFLIFALKIECGYSLESPHWGGSNVYPKSMFEKNKEIIQKS